MKTYSPSANDIVHEWHVIDASGKTLGRLATEVSCLLMGKHKAVYTPNMDTGDYVIVINASQIKVSGKKPDSKIYYRYSGYHGGLKKPTYRDIFEKNPCRVVEMAIKGMLPHNKRGAAMYGKLRVYPSASHPHMAQVEAKRSDN